MRQTMKPPIAKLREAVIKQAMRWAKHHEAGHYGTYAITCLRLKKACAALASRQKRGGA